MTYGPQTVCPCCYRDLGVVTPEHLTHVQERGSSLMIELQNARAQLAKEQEVFKMLPAAAASRAKT
jgi:hypothetical protein